MKAILIDDEKPALQQLERLLRAGGTLTVTGKYTSAAQGIDHLRAEKADVVFLDIDMPELNGLKAAELIRKTDAAVRIVYVTAYAEHAVDAFELDAFDYLLKPIHPARLDKTLKRLEAASAHTVPEIRGDSPDPAASGSGQKPQRAEAAERSRAAQDMPTEPAEPLLIRCFKRLEIYEHGMPSDRVKWRTNKVQELFAFLLHNAGMWVPRDRILDALWPDASQDKAVTYLHTSVYHIRKLFKTVGLTAGVAFQQERYRLSGDDLPTDVGSFADGLSAEPIRSDDEWKRSNAVLLLYRGDYLEEHDYEWAAARREELQIKYRHMVLRSVAYETATGRERMALEKLHALQDRNPYAEDLCRLILEQYRQAKDYAAVRRHYERFVQLLRSDLGIGPDPELERWVRSSMPGFIPQGESPA